MAESAPTSDCTKQKQQLLRIAKLKLPTLAVAGSDSGSSLKTHFNDDAGQFHFELIRSEADKRCPTLLASLLSNGFFRIPGTFHHAKGRANLLIQSPAAGFIAKNPLVGMLAGLFSEIKQELAMEGRKLSLMQSEYFKECIRRSRKPGTIYRNITPPTDTANTRVLQLKNDLSLFFEIMEGRDSEGIKIKAACEMPSLPDIYSSTNEPKATTTSADSSVKKLADATSFPIISGFNTLLFNLASRGNNK